MKITDITLSAVHVNHRGDWVFVHVHTDEGISGIGELKAGKNYDAQVTAVRDLKSQLIGRNPGHIEAIFAEFRTDERYQLCALSAIDQALWDILGKSLGVPVYMLLGGAAPAPIVGKLASAGPLPSTAIVWKLHGLFD